MVNEIETSKMRLDIVLLVEEKVYGTRSISGRVLYDTTDSLPPEQRIPAREILYQRGIVDVATEKNEDDQVVRNLSDLIESIEKKEIAKALRIAKENKTTAAELLGTSRFTLQRKLEKYGMDPEVRE